VVFPGEGVTAGWAVCQIAFTHIPSRTRDDAGPLVERSSSVKRLLALGAAALVAAAAVATAAGAAPASPSGSAPAAADAKSLAAASAAHLVASKAAGLHVSAADAFIQHPVVSSKEGLQYVPYERTYHGLPVFGGDFVVVTNSAGQVLSTSVAQTRTITLSSLLPAVGAGRAAEIARSAQHATVDGVASNRLVVFALSGTPRLAWESVVAGHRGATPSRLHVFVDAGTGAVAYSYDEVADGTGNAAINGGTVTIQTSGSGTSFSMTDSTRPGISCRNETSGAVLTGTDDIWGNGDGTNIETGCVDALYSVQHEWDMLGTWLGRSGINGSGSGFPVFVGLNDLNAFWNGSQVHIGHNQAGAWISSMDVVGHEYGHAIDSTTPGGTSGNGVSEATGDIFGASLEFFTQNSFDPPDYTVGEEINLVGNGPIRIMYDPSLVGDPACYSSSVPTMETHAAAGPFDHWFVLASQGSAASGGLPASPTCNGSSVTGLGPQTVLRIFYNAMLSKTSGMTYLRYRTATLNSAINLFPGNCGPFNTIKAAWDAVSVPAQSGDPTCGGGGAVTVTNPGSRTGTVGTATSLQMTASGGTPPYTWSATGLPSGLTINSSTGLISGTPSTAGTFSVTVTARDSVGTTGSASFTWTINPVGGGCGSPGQKLGNPGFESGVTVWSQTPAVIGQNGPSEPAHSGTWDAWMDGYGTTHTDTLSQTVTLPSGCTTYTLTYFLHIDTAETTTTTQFDKLTVTMGSTTVATFSNLNKAAGYTQRSVDVSAFAGQTVTLKFTATEDSSLQTSFVVDDTALNVS
jgi:Zn-dependent metalloprotease